MAKFEVPKLTTRIFCPKLGKFYSTNAIMRSGKREKPYYSRHAPYSQPKRRRPLPLDAAPENDAEVSSSKSSAPAKAPTLVVVIGVPAECSVLDLKSKFEMYGPISRTRMEPDGVAYINFRSNEAAQSAVDAARDSSFPVTLHSTPVQVMWASDPVPQRKGGLQPVRQEVPLSSHGRGNKVESAIVNPRDDSKEGGINSSSIEGPFRGREIVAYDDIL